MFNLSNFKLIKLNDDGTDGEIIRTNRPTLHIGTALHYDYVITNPEQEIFCEISTDSFGRVKITNHTRQPLLINDEVISKERPLYRDSIITINSVEKFRWEKNDSDEKTDAEYASWSDPGKKMKKGVSKIVKKIVPGRLTVHALCQISSTENQVDLTTSRNNSVKSFVDENDEENKSNISVRDDSQSQPKSPLKMNNTSTPIVPTSGMKSTDARVGFVEETPIKQLLEVSHSTVTSYTPKTAGRYQSVVSNTTQSATLKSCYSTPTSSVFKTIEHNDNSTMGKSFCDVVAPKTPASAHPSRVSVYLIDLTTPDVFHTPTASPSTANTGRTKTLLKSAIKNSTKKTTATLNSTPKMSVLTSISDVSHSGRSDKRDDSVRSVVVGTSSQKQKPGHSSGGRRLMAPRQIIASTSFGGKVTPLKSKIDKKLTAVRSASASKNSPYTKNLAIFASTPVTKKDLKHSFAFSAANRSTVGKDKSVTDDEKLIMATASPSPSLMLAQLMEESVDENGLGRDMALPSETTVLNKTFEINDDAGNENELGDKEDKDLTPEEMMEILLEKEETDEDGMVYEVLSEEALLAESSDDNASVIDTVQVGPVSTTNVVGNVSSVSTPAKEENKLSPKTDSHPTSEPANDCAKIPEKVESPDAGTEVDSAKESLETTQYEGRVPVEEELCIQKHINYGHDCDNVLDTGARSPANQNRVVPTILIESADDETEQQTNDEIEPKSVDSSPIPVTDFDEIDNTCLDVTQGWKKLISEELIEDKVNLEETAEVNAKTSEGIDTVINDILSIEESAANDQQSMVEPESNAVFENTIDDLPIEGTNYNLLEPESSDEFNFSNNMTEDFDHPPTPLGREESSVVQHLDQSLQETNTIEVEETFVEDPTVRDIFAGDEDNQVSSAELLSQSIGNTVLDNKTITNVANTDMDMSLDEIPATQPQNQSIISSVSMIFSPTNSEGPETLVHLPEAASKFVNSPLSDCEESFIQEDQIICIAAPSTAISDEVHVLDLIEASETPRPLDGATDVSTVQGTEITNDANEHFANETLISDDVIELPGLEDEDSNIDGDRFVENEENSELHRQNIEGTAFTALETSNKDYLLDENISSHENIQSELSENDDFGVPETENVDNSNEVIEYSPKVDNASDIYENSIEMSPPNAFSFCEGDSLSAPRESNPVTEVASVINSASAEIDFIAQISDADFEDMVEDAKSPITQISSSQLEAAVIVEDGADSDVLQGVTNVSMANVEEEANPSNESVALEAIHDANTSQNEVYQLEEANLQNSIVEAKESSNPLETDSLLVICTESENIPLYLPVTEESGQSDKCEEELSNSEGDEYDTEIPPEVEKELLMDDNETDVVHESMQEASQINESVLLKTEIIADNSSYCVLNTPLKATTPRDDFADDFEAKNSDSSSAAEEFNKSLFSPVRGTSEFSHTPRRTPLRKTLITIKTSDSHSFVESPRRSSRASSSMDYTALVAPSQKKQILVETQVTCDGSEVAAENKNVESVETSVEFVADKPIELEKEEVIHEEKVSVEKSFTANPAFGEENVSENDVVTENSSIKVQCVDMETFKNELEEHPKITEPIIAKSNTLNIDTNDNRRESAHLGSTNQSFSMLIYDGSSSEAEIISEGEDIDELNKDPMPESIEIDADVPATLMNNDPIENESGLTTPQNEYLEVGEASLIVSTTERSEEFQLNVETSQDDREETQVILVLPTIKDTDISASAKTPLKVRSQTPRKTPLRKPRAIEAEAVVDSPRRSGRAGTAIDYAALVTPGKKKNALTKVVEVAEVTGNELNKTVVASEIEDEGSSMKVDAENKVETGSEKEDVVQEEEISFTSKPSSEEENAVVSLIQDVHIEKIDEFVFDKSPETIESNAPNSETSNARTEHPLSYGGSLDAGIITENDCSGEYNKDKMPETEIESRIRTPNNECFKAGEPSLDAFNTERSDAVQLNVESSQDERQVTPPEEVKESPKIDSSTPAKSSLKVRSQTPRKTPLRKPRVNEVQATLDSPRRSARAGTTIDYAALVTPGKKKNAMTKVVEVPDATSYELNKTVSEIENDGLPTEVRTDNIETASGEEIISKDNSVNDVVPVENITKIEKPNQSIASISQLDVLKEAQDPTPNISKNIIQENYLENKDIKESIPVSIEEEASEGDENIPEVQIGRAGNVSEHDVASSENQTTESAPVCSNDVVSEQDDETVAPSIEGDVAQTKPGPPINTSIMVTPKRKVQEVSEIRPTETIKTPPQNPASLDIQIMKTPATTKSKAKLVQEVEVASLRTPRQRNPPKFLDDNYVTPGKRTPQARSITESVKRTRGRATPFNLMREEENERKSTEYTSEEVSQVSQQVAPIQSEYATIENTVDEKNEEDSNEIIEIGDSIIVDERMSVSSVASEAAKENDVETKAVKTSSHGKSARARKNVDTEEVVSLVSESGDTPQTLTKAAKRRGVVAKKIESEDLLTPEVMSVKPQRRGRGKEANSESQDTEVEDLEVDNKRSTKRKIAKKPQEMQVKTSRQAESKHSAENLESETTNTEEDVPKPSTSKRVAKKIEKDVPVKATSSIRRPKRGDSIESNTTGDEELTRKRRGAQKVEKDVSPKATTSARGPKRGDPIEDHSTNDDEDQPKSSETKRGAKRGARKISQESVVNADDEPATKTVRPGRRAKRNLSTESRNTEATNDEEETPTPTPKRAAKKNIQTQNQKAVETIDKEKVPKASTSRRRAKESTDQDVVTVEVPTKRATTPLNKVKLNEKVEENSSQEKKEKKAPKRVKKVSESEPSAVEVVELKTRGRGRPRLATIDIQQDKEKPKPVAQKRGRGKTSKEADNEVSSSSSTLTVEEMKETEEPTSKRSRKEVKKPDLAKADEESAEPKPTRRGKKVVATKTPVEDTSETIELDEPVTETKPPVRRGRKREPVADEQETDEEQSLPTPVKVTARDKKASSEESEDVKKPVSKAKRVRSAAKDQKVEEEPAESEEMPPPKKVPARGRKRVSEESVDAERPSTSQPKRGRFSSGSDETDEAVDEPKTKRGKSKLALKVETTEDPVKVTRKRNAPAKEEDEIQSPIARKTRAGRKA